MKFENILVQKIKDADDYGVTEVVKIIDFGVSENTDTTMKAIVGTPWYMAPEVVKR